MGSRLTILGAGESGVGAALLAQHQGLKVWVSDSGMITPQYQKLLDRNNIEYEQGTHSMDKILNADEIVKSPGIPDQLELIQTILDAGIPIISELEFASRYTEAMLITITGTNGKSTTTLLTHHLLKESGIDVGLAGNIGDSLAKQVMEGASSQYVIEVSSFQLDGMYNFKSDIAVLLNITPDHLDRYDFQLQRYIDSKFRIIQNMTSTDHFIFFKDDPIIEREIEKRDIKAQLHPISLTKAVGNGAFCKGGWMVFNLENPSLETTVRVEDVPLKGKHNIINAMASLMVSLIEVQDTSSLPASLIKFKNAPHRMEFVDSINQVEFINDSKATNVDAVYYALDGIDQPIVWIAGGIDKGNDYNVLKTLVMEKVKILICIGVENTKLREAFEVVAKSILEVVNMEEAVIAAHSMAVKGDVVLLSPACASFDLFKNYEDRGDQFKKSIKTLKVKLNMSHKSLVL